MPFRTVAISMVQNEADIIEYFVRANLKFIDHFVIIVNPSNDGTREILDALLFEGAPITIWLTERNVYRQGAIYSWMLNYVRDNWNPDYIIMIDCDEIILCESKQKFLCDLEKIPPNHVGTLPWRTFAPTSTRSDFNFYIEDFDQSLVTEVNPHFKIAVRSITEIWTGDAVQNGAHGLLGISGDPLSLYPLKNIELAHLPVRSLPQIIDKSVRSIVAKTVWQGFEWMNKESYQYISSLNRIRHNIEISTASIANSYVIKDHGEISDAATQIDKRLPKPRLMYGNLMNNNISDHERISGQILSSIYPDPDPVEPLKIKSSKNISENKEISNNKKLPLGAFHPDIHAHSLKCDWPPIEAAFQMFRPASVLDIGCGLGAYLKLLQDKGARIAGVDGAEWSDQHLISKDEYHSWDLSCGLPPRLATPFDVSICLETLEHLPEDAGLKIISSLASRSIHGIIFSAAQPGQPGNKHINCRPHKYWLDAFSESGWVVDVPGSARLRLLSTLIWFQRNIFVLRPASHFSAQSSQLERLLVLGEHQGGWPTHEAGQTIIGFPGQHPSFRHADNSVVSPAPIYERPVSSGELRAALVKSELAKNTLSSRLSASQSRVTESNSALKYASHEIFDLINKIDLEKKYTLEKDNVITNNNLSIKIIEKEIEEKSQTISDLEKEIYFLRTSTSWRLTKPLRTLKEWFRRTE